MIRPGRGIGGMEGKVKKREPENRKSELPAVIPDEVSDIRIRRKWNRHGGIKGCRGGTALSCPGAA